MYVSGEWVSLKARSHILTDSEKWVDLKNVLWKLKPLRSDTDIFNFRQSNQQLAAVAVAAAAASTKDCFMFEIIKKNELVSTVLCNLVEIFSLWFFHCYCYTLTTAAVLSGTYRIRLKLLGCLDSDFPNETLISYKINSKINIPFFKHRKWASQASSHRISLAEQQKEKSNYKFSSSTARSFHEKLLVVEITSNGSQRPAGARERGKFEEKENRTDISAIRCDFFFFFFIFSNIFISPHAFFFASRRHLSFIIYARENPHVSERQSGWALKRSGSVFVESTNETFFPFPSFARAYSEQ